jgi:hypothetical protein
LSSLRYKLSKFLTELSNEKENKGVESVLSCFEVTLNKLSVGACQEGQTLQHLYDQTMIDETMVLINRF